MTTHLRSIVVLSKSGYEIVYGTDQKLSGVELITPV
jgi:hypothetical protein